MNVTDMTVLEKLEYGGGVFLFGFSIVFICLVLLIAYVAIQTLLLKASHKPKKGKSASKANVKPSNDFVGQVALDDKKLIAALTGAIATYLGTNAGDIVIRKYRRIGSNAPAWRRAGRRDQVFNKF